MALTPEQIAKIRQKDAEMPDALKRNPLNDYTEGWFHVTLNTRDGNGERVPTISREMCLVMNELARIISNVKDDWWKQ